MMTEKAQFDALQQSLYDYFGYSEFRAGQREVLEHLMSGKDALAVFPTGAGKSLTYQLAALLMPGTAIMVSPSDRPYARPGGRFAEPRIEGVSAINSTLTVQEVSEHLTQMSSGDGKLLYVTPERCSDPEFLEHLERTNVCLVRCR